MKTVASVTLGCKVNQYDTQAMLERFAGAGYAVVPFAEKADVYLVNTCTVTGTGDQKSMQMIRRAARKNPEADIVVTGCMAQRAAERLLLPGVKLVLGTQRRGEVVQLLQQAQEGGAPLIAVEALTGAVYEALEISQSETRTRATLKIQEGCDGRCAYCIIPSVRGPVRSRPLAEVVREALRLSTSGFQEIVLTGIHLSSYGKDLGEGMTLLDAIRVVHDVAGVRRIRLGSLEPRIVDADFAKSLRDMPKVCPHFTLALQSGCDSVLARMARRYNTTQYAGAAECLRAEFPDAALSTDVMVGFSGETEEEHAKSMAFIERMALSRIHVFPYSPREGTVAVQMPDQVPQNVKARRATEMIALGERLAESYAKSLIGKVFPVLLEEETAPGRAAGYIPHYVRVETDGQPGQIVFARLLRAQKDGIIGDTMREESGNGIR